MNTGTLIRCAMIAALGVGGCTRGPAGSAGLDGNGEVGDPGLPGEAQASITAITPDRVFLDREAEVLISAHGTNWTDGDTIEIEFGEGVQVVSGTVSIASPTALIATVDVSETARRGLHAVTVRDGDSVARRDVALAVTVPTTVGMFFNGGSVTQGSVLAVPVVQHDASTPFDAVQQGNLLVYLKQGSTNADPLAPYHDAFIEPYYAQAFIVIDVFQTAGLTDVIVENGPRDDPLVSVAQEAIPVIEHAARSLPPGTEHDVMAVWGGSKLYELEPVATEPRLVEVTTIADEPDNAALIVLPETGRFEDALAFSPYSSSSVRFILPPSQQRFLVYWSQTFEERNYGIELTRTDFPLQELTPGVPWFAPARSTELPDFYRVDLGQNDEVQVTVGDGIVSSCGPFGPDAIFADMRVLGTDARTVVSEGTFQADDCPVATFTADEDGTYFIEVVVFPWFGFPVDYSVVVEVM